MARKVDYKMIQVTPGAHEQLQRLSEASGLSLTKLADMLIRKAISDIDSSGGDMSFSMSKNDNGEVVLTLL